VGYAREAVKLAPEQPIAYACLADTLARKMIGRNAGLRAARRAIELAPDSPMGYLAAGNVELHHRGAKHARSWYEQASALDPTSRPVQKNLAVAHSHLGRQDTALALTRSLLELDPRDERSRAMIDDEVLHLIIRLQQLVAALAIVTYLRDLMRRSWLISVEAAGFIVGVIAVAIIPAFRQTTDVAIGISYLGFFLQFAVRRPTARARR
jgi:tetratricopeptide (TPR) repeat protein